MSVQPTPKRAAQRLPLWYLGRPAAAYIDALTKRAGTMPASARHSRAGAHRPAAPVTGGGRGIDRRVDDLRGQDLHVLAKHGLVA